MLPDMLDPSLERLLGQVTIMLWLLDTLLALLITTIIMIALKHLLCHNSVEVEGEVEHAGDQLPSVYGTLRGMGIDRYQLDHPLLP